MYRCYHLKSSMSKKRSEYLFRRYIAYAGFTLILLFFAYADWRTGMDKYTILPNGHCSFADPSYYSMRAACVFVCVFACVCACVRACVCVCVRARGY